jgi:hypothetical protein
LETYLPSGDQATLHTGRTLCLIPARPFTHQPPKPRRNQRDSMHL